MSDEWRYLRTGSRTHRLIRVFDRLTHVAECGRSPQIGEDWYGTGSQTEYERVDAMPRCKRCLPATPTPTERTTK